MLPVRPLLNGEYYNKISKLVGESNIIPMERDLTSIDGLDDYGTCTDKITLLSVSEYVKCHKILGLKSNYSSWLWLITPASTPSNDCFYGVCYVNSHGIPGWINCDCRGDIRPFFCLNSSVMVSV